MVGSILKHLRRFVVRQTAAEPVRVVSLPPARSAAAPPDTQLQAEVRQLRARVAELEATCARQERDLFPTVAAGVVNAIKHLADNAYLTCNLNGVTVQLPKYTLLTMVHCVHGALEGPVPVWVESNHLKWVMARLRPGGVFLDVGAATGAMALPIARQFDGNLTVIAFEPNRTTNRVLRDTLAVNGITNVEVQDCAVSDQAGTAEFWAYGHDETGQTPYLPETSALSSGVIDRARAQPYEVPVTTLDKFLADRGAAARVTVMKIDVEGFEVNVLDGALGFLRRYRPPIAIDIHKNPFREGDTERPVRERLGPLGYEFAKMDHVLTCSPK